MNIHVTLPQSPFSKKSPRLKLLIKGEEGLTQKILSFIYYLYRTEWISHVKIGLYSVIGKCCCKQNKSFSNIQLQKVCLLQTYHEGLKNTLDGLGVFFGLTKFVEQLSKNFFYLTVRHSESKR